MNELVKYFTKDYDKIKLSEILGLTKGMDLIDDLTINNISNLYI